MFYAQRCFFPSCITGIYSNYLYRLFLLILVVRCRAIVPTLQGYEDAGDFTVTKRFKTSIHQNVVLYASVGGVGALGVLIMIFMNKLHWCVSYTPL